MEPPPITSASDGYSLVRAARHQFVQLHPLEDATHELRSGGAEFLPAIQCTNASTSLTELRPARLPQRQRPAHLWLRCRHRQGKRQKAGAVGRAAGLKPGASWLAGWLAGICGRLAGCWLAAGWLTGCLLARSVLAGSASWLSASRAACWLLAELTASAGSASLADWLTNGCCLTGWLAKLLLGWLLASRLADCLTDWPAGSLRGSLTG